jgi:hypothetical protein
MTGSLQAVLGVGNPKASGGGDFDPGYLKESCPDDIVLIKRVGVP